MPQTVPKRPMNGVAEAAGGQKAVQALQAAMISAVGGPQQRPVHAFACPDFAARRPRPICMGDFPVAEAENFAQGVVAVEDWSCG